MGSYAIYGPKLGSYWDHIRVGFSSRARGAVMKPCDGSRIR
jgi:hypothetical protein